MGKFALFLRGVLDIIQELLIQLKDIMHMLKQIVDLREKEIIVMFIGI